MERGEALVGKSVPVPVALPDPDIDVEADVKAHSLKNDADIWKRRYQAAVKELSVENRLYRLMDEWGSRLPPLPAFKVSLDPNSKLMTTETIVLLLSDLHVGETVSEQAMHGLNRYDIPTFIARMEFLLDRIISITSNRLTGYRFEALHIHLLGDLVNGMFGAMHDELLVTQAAPLMDTVYGTAYVLAQFIDVLRAYFPKIKILAAPGNHGRMQKKPWAKEADQNWDMVIPQIVSLWFRGAKDVEFDIPKSFFFIDDIYGQKILGLHGHQIKGWSGIPWYGIKRFDDNLTGALAKNGVDIDHIVLGHFHTEAIMDRVAGETIANPCMKGADEFTLSAGFRPATAGQTMFGMHAKHGITHRWRINLQNPTPVKTKLAWLPGASTLGSLEI